MNSQEIVVDYPPLYDDIAMKFNLHPSDSIIFSWGKRIYNPMDVEVGPELLAHELVHGERQGTSGKDIKSWWARYCLHTHFRLAEEILAHRAEYNYLIEHGNRQRRRSALKHTAGKLAAPMYGNMITQADAKGVLRTH